MFWTSNGWQLKNSLWRMFIVKLNIFSENQYSWFSVLETVSWALHDSVNYYRRLPIANAKFMSRNIPKWKILKLRSFVPSPGFVSLTSESCDNPIQLTLCLKSYGKNGEIYINHIMLVFRHSMYTSKACWIKIALCSSQINQPSYAWGSHHVLLIPQ